MKIRTVVALCALALVGWCEVRMEPTNETYVLPAGFTGPVLIIFDQADGAPQEHAGFRRIYRIPPDGVLRTRFGDRWSGMFSSVFRYGSPTGPEIRERGYGMAPPPDTAVLAWMHGSTGDVPHNESWLIGRAADRPAMEARLDSLLMANVKRNAADPPSR